MKLNRTICCGVLALALLAGASQTACGINLNGTLVRTSAADPCLIFDNGTFYLTMTGSTKIAMIVDKDLGCLTTSVHPTTENIIYDSKYDPSVEELFGEGAVLNGTWSPEIHYFSEEEFPGNSGWYMYLSLRQKVVLENGKVSSKNIRMVVMKSSSGKVDGPYVSPVTSTPNQTQAILEPDGEPLRRWAVGPSVLRVPSGQYKGTYLMWIEEVGRGEGLGKFYQTIMISKFSAPWQLEGEPGLITMPTQEWEFHGSSQTHPRVVEGATGVYGDNGEVFLAYCGSGYWSDYGLGQLTLKRENGDYANPLETKSWIKYAGNPVFSSVGHPELRGAGHGFFLKDAAGNRFVCYHAYPFVDGKKAKGRNAYIEPYYIDKGAACPTAPEGVLRIGIAGAGQPGLVDSRVKFVTKAPKKK
ncbi:MAG: family 43 glycosylhydrolase [Bacteroidales bacterium]|nr:family 43 glycosylhydrolase [Bacteroidales bacterium]